MPHFLFFSFYDVSLEPAKVLSGLAPLEAVLFDIDRTLCDLDLIHFNAFHKMLHR
ncbi:hypothetical protein ACE6H2_014028 [Prunus campanulata]